MRTALKQIILFIENKYIAYFEIVLGKLFLTSTDFIRYEIYHWFWDIKH